MLSEKQNKLFELAWKRMRTEISIETHVQANEVVKQFQAEKKQILQSYKENRSNVLMLPQAICDILDSTSDSVVGRGFGAIQAPAFREFMKNEHFVRRFINLLVVDHKIKKDEKSFGLLQSFSMQHGNIEANSIYDLLFDERAKHITPKPSLQARRTEIMIFIDYMTTIRDSAEMDAIYDLFFETKHEHKLSFFEKSLKIRMAANAFCEVNHPGASNHERASLPYFLIERNL